MQWPCDTLDDIIRLVKDYRKISWLEKEWHGTLLQMMKLPSQMDAYEDFWTSRKPELEPNATAIDEM